MPIKLPNLDDRTFADLVKEAHALIPVHAPAWTNHNESDPGITLIELFAYLTEILIYRLNRVTDANMCAFLRLVDGIERRPSEQNRGMVWIQNKGIECLAEVALSDEVREVVLNLRQQDRAVTCADFERLALAADSRVKRAHCVTQRDLTSTTPYEKADAHVSVVIYPGEVALEGEPTVELAKIVRDYLEPRRLLATRVHVRGPRLVTIAVHVSIYLKPDAVKENVERAVRTKLAKFFSPLSSEHEHEGWPFGRNVYVSDIYQLLDQIQGVDFVMKLNGWEILTAPEAEGERRILLDGGLVAVRLNSDELVDLSLDQSHIVFVSPLKKEFEQDDGR